jgi:hypothetical protein
MTLFLYRLFPPRPKTFASDMTAEELNVMLHLMPQYGLSSKVSP